MSQNQFPGIQFRPGENHDVLVNAEEDIGGRALRFIAGNFQAGQKDIFLPEGAIAPPGARTKIKVARRVFESTSLGWQPRSLWLAARFSQQFLTAVSGLGKPFNTVVRITRMGSGTSTTYSFIPIGITNERPAPIAFLPSYGGAGQNGQAQQFPVPQGAPSGLFVPAYPTVPQLQVMQAPQPFTAAPPVFQQPTTAAPQWAPPTYQASAPQPVSQYTELEQALLKGFREEQSKGNAPSLDKVTAILNSVIPDPARIGFVLQNAFNPDGTVKP